MIKKMFTRQGSALSLIIILNIPIILVALITTSILFKDISTDITRLNIDKTSHITQLSDNIIQQAVSPSFMIEDSAHYPDFQKFISNKSIDTEKIFLSSLSGNIKSLAYGLDTSIYDIAVYSPANETVVTATSVSSMSQFYNDYLDGSNISPGGINELLNRASIQSFFIPSTAVNNSTNTIFQTMVLCRKIYPYSKNPGFFFAVIDMSIFTKDVTAVSGSDAINFAICDSDNDMLYQDDTLDYSEANRLNLNQLQGDLIEIGGNTYIYQSSKSANIKYIYTFEGNGLTGNLPRIILIFILLELLAIAFGIFFGGRKAIMLDKSITSLSQSNLNLSIRLKNNSIHLRKQVISAILNGKNTDTEEALRQKYEIIFPFSSYRVMAICFTDAFIRLNGKDKASEITDEIRFAMENNEIICYFSQLNESYCGAIINYDDEELLHSNIFRIIGDIIMTYNCDANMYVGISTKADMPGGFNSFYEDALLSAHYGEENRLPVTYFDDIHHSNSNEIYYPYEIERQLYESIAGGKTEEVASILDKLREINFITRKLPYFMLQKLVSLVTVVIYKIIDEMYDSDEELKIKYTRACRNIVRADDPSEGYHFLSEIALSISGDFECTAANQEFKEKIVNFINKNYANPDLSLAMLAAHINISYHHLSHVFTDYMGETFISYLTKCRLEHSKELLLQCDDKIDTIAKMSGFSGSNTFIKTFKKHYGITPGQYRGQGNTELE